MTHLIRTSMPCRCSRASHLELTGKKVRRRSALAARSNRGERGKDRLQFFSDGRAVVANLSLRLLRYEQATSFQDVSVRTPSRRMSKPSVS